MLCIINQFGYIQIYIDWDVGYSKIMAFFVVKDNE